MKIGEELRENCGTLTLVRQPLPPQRISFFSLSRLLFTLSKRYEHSKVKYKGSVKCDVKESIQQQPYKITSKKE
jgi:hypothetical protein